LFWSRFIKGSNIDQYSKKLTWISQGGNGIFEAISTEIQKKAKKGEVEFEFEYEKNSINLGKKKYRIPVYMNMQIISKCLKAVGFECRQLNLANTSKSKHLIKW
jgi:hypothetical protein